MSRFQRSTNKLDGLDTVMMTLRGEEYDGLLHDDSSEFERERKSICESIKKFKQVEHE